MGPRGRSITEEIWKVESALLSPRLGSRGLRTMPRQVVSGQLAHNKNRNEREFVSLVSIIE